MKTSNKHGSKEEHHQHKQAERPAVTKKEMPEAAKKTANYYPLISVAIILVLLALVIYLLVRNPENSVPISSNDGFEGDKVKVEFYVMSQCPYGTQVVDAMAPVLENIGDGVDFHIDYIVREIEAGTFQSLHGEKEVKGNIVQLCAKSYFPDEYKYVKFIVCQNKDAANVDTNWVTCAQEVGIDPEKIRSCIESDEGKGLLRTSMQAAQARGATGSPTIYINDVAYSGGRDSLSFQRAICKQSKHPGCEGMPICASDADCTEQAGKEGYCSNPGKSDATCIYKDPVVVNYIILNDKECASCDTTNIVQASQQLFMGGKPRLVDVSSEEGKVLVEKYKIQVVPAYIFEKSVEQTKSWTATPALASYFDVLSDGSHKLKDEVTGANYFVSEESRKAYYDMIGIKKGDNKPQIDFFVMSYCPYGNQAEEGIYPVYNLLKEKALFKPRYVIYENYQGGGSDYCIEGGKYCSMHGIQELNQNIREMCVNKLYGVGKWFEFSIAMNTNCTYMNADTCWEPVAKKVGLDAAKIKDCFTKDGVALVADDKKLGDFLKVQGSPTVFVEGDSYNGGRTPEAYKASICAGFEKAPSECSKMLDSGASAAPATGSC